MKRLFAWFGIGLLLLLLNTVIRSMTGISSGNTNYFSLEMIWFAGIILTLYGFGGLVFKLVTGAITFELKNRVDFISGIVNFFRYLIHPRSEKKKEKGKSKYKKIIWGVVIIYSIGSAISYIFMSK